MFENWNLMAISFGVKCLGQLIKNIICHNFFDILEILNLNVPRVLQCEKKPDFVNPNENYVPSKEGLWRVREKVQRGCYCRPLPFEWWRRPLSFSSSCDSHSDCCWLEAARDHVWGRLFGLLLLLTILKAKGWI